MADNKAKPTEKPKQTEKAKPSAGDVAPQPSRRSGGWRIILSMVVAVPVVLFSGLPTLLLCVGLIPTLIALVTDQDHDKSGATTIGFMNVAGVLPFVIELWEKGQTMENAIAILKEPVTWLVMLGAAGVGQLILYAIPPATGALTITRMELRLRTLREALAQLKEIWGADVTTVRALDQVRKKDGGNG